MIEPDPSNHHGIRNSVEETQREHKRRIKLGNPATKIVEIVEKN
jgi:hypothetical protein